LFTYKSVPVIFEPPCTMLYYGYRRKGGRLVYERLEKNIDF